MDHFNGLAIPETLEDTLDPATLALLVYDMQVGVLAQIDDADRVLGNVTKLLAAARDRQFFAAFGRVHPTKHFPHVSLLTIGAIALPFCFFSLGQLVGWLIQVQILLQFIWQCAAVMLLRSYRPDIPKPFRMWLYPLPALVSLAMWLYIFASSPLPGGSGALRFAPMPSPAPVSPANPR